MTKNNQVLLDVSEIIASIQKEKEDLKNKIISVQNDENAFTIAKLYNAGMEAREKGDGIEATMHLWQALICGEGKAAYPLFEMLRDGEGGIPQNMEMAGIFLCIGRKFAEQSCIKTPNIKNMPYDAADEIYYSICMNSRKFISNHGYKITDEILSERQAAADAILDNFYLQTRAYEQSMLDVFQNPVHIVEERISEIYLTGEGES